MGFFQNIMIKTIIKFHASRNVFPEFIKASFHINLFTCYNVLVFTQ